MRADVSFYMSAASLKLRMSILFQLTVQLHKGKSEQIRMVIDIDTD